MDVVDTTVFAYALLGEPAHKEEALAVLGKARDIAVPDHFRAEFANVVWQWVRANRLPPDEALTTLAACEPLLTNVLDGRNLWEAALLLSLERDHPVYDTFYIALARLLKTQTVTYDKRLRAKFPGEAIAPEDFLR